MTITVPWRRMTLQLSQRALTEALTFNGSSIVLVSADRWPDILEAVGDPAAGQVVGRQLDADAVAGQDPDEVHPELAADVGQDAMAVLQLDREHGVRQRLDDRALDFDRILLGHRLLVLPFLTRSVGPDGPTHERVAYQRRCAGSAGNRRTRRSWDGGQDLAARDSVDRDGVLEVGGQRAVARSTTVQPSGRIATSSLPSVNIGSMARQMPGLELACPRTPVR